MADLRNRGTPVLASLLTGLAIVSSGCRAGSRNIVPDRFDYSNAIALSNNEQLLSNIVRLRYGEAPVFLGVGSVLTQYSYATGGAVTGAVAAETTAVPGWTVGAGATGLYVERPTISYAPLTGQDFVKQLLEPVDSKAVFSLVQAGWSSEELLKLTLESINGVDGRLSSQPTRSEFESLSEFHEVVDLVLAIADRQGLEMHRDPEGGTSAHLVLAEDTDEETVQLIADFKAALNLDPDRWKFRVTEREIRSADEITIRVRSFASMLSIASRGVLVPAAHLDEGRVDPVTTPGEAPALREACSTPDPLSEGASRGSVRRGTDEGVLVLRLPG